MDILEKELGRVLRLHAELFEIAAPGESRPIRLDKEERHAARAGRRVRLGRKHDDVAKLAVRDEDLLAVDHVFVARAPGLGANGLEVATGMRLGHAERTDRLALDHFWQPVAFLFFGPERKDVSRHEIGMD